MRPRHQELADFEGQLPDCLRQISCGWDGPEKAVGLATGRFQRAALAVVPPRVAPQSDMERLASHLDLWALWRLLFALGGCRALTGEMWRYISATLCWVSWEAGFDWPPVVERLAARGKP